MRLRNGLGRGMVFARVSVGLLIAAAPMAASAALDLKGTSYSESFDQIGEGLPDGWSVRTGATATGVGTAVDFSGSVNTWGDSGAAFKNLASAEGLNWDTSTADQRVSVDRALGIRQTGSFGDPGAAFVLEIADTKGLQGFNLSFEAQMLSVQGRSTVWTIDYRVGDGGNFIALGAYSDPSKFGSTPVSFKPDQLSVWDNKSETIWFRVVALNASTGSVNRDTFAIDDFSLTYSAVPEPAEWGLLSGGLLLGILGWHTWRERRGLEPVQEQRGGVVSCSASRNRSAT